MISPNDFDGNAYNQNSVIHVSPCFALN